MQENDELKAKDKQQRQQIDLLEANEKELAKKNHSNQKVRCHFLTVGIELSRLFSLGWFSLLPLRPSDSLFQVIKMLTEKCKSQEEEIAEFEMREQEFQDMEAEADLMRQQLESSRLIRFC